MSSRSIHPLPHVSLNACVLLMAFLFGCSSDSGPVATPPGNNPGVAAPVVTYENPLPPPVNIMGMACLGPGTIAVCASPGFVALFQNGAWRVLNTGRGVELLAVWGTSADDFYVVGAGGCVLHWDGGAFSDIDVGTADNFFAVWGTATNDVWMCGDATIAHWDGSSGTVYEESSLPANGTYFGVGGSSTTDVYVVGSNGNVLHWNGTSWSLVTTGLGSTTELHAVYVTGNEVFVAAQDLHLWHFDGASWSSFTAVGGAFDDFNTVTGTGPNRVYAFGADGLMYRWNGTAWVDIFDAFFPSSYDITTACAVGTNIVVGGYYNATAATNIARFDGTSWASFQSSGATNTDLFAVWTFNKNSAFAVGDAGTIVHRDAVGWSTVTHSLTTEPLFGMWASGPADVYAVGRNGTVLHYDGTSWASVNTGLGTATLIDVSGNAANNVWMGGSHTLWHWDGVTWADRSNELSPSVSYGAIYVAPGGTVFAAGDDLALFDGTSWRTVSLKAGVSGRAADVEDIWGTSATDVWIADYYNGLLHWDGVAVELRWPDISGEAYAIAARASTALAGQDGNLVQFVSGNMNAVVPFATGASVYRGHTGDDGTTYFVGEFGLIVRVE